MKQYLDLLKKVNVLGAKRAPAREGMPDSLNLFGESLEMVLSDGFPLLTTKKMYWNGIITELLWFLRGESNLYFLWKNNVHIWDQDCYRFYKRNNPNPMSYENWLAKLNRLMERDTIDARRDFIRMTNCGAIYPIQWRGNFIWPPCGSHNDQILYILKNMIRNPTSRYHIVNAWNPTDIDRENEKHDIMALPPCHVMHQVLVDDEHKCFDMVMYQRSADIFLGMPFNIASYAALMEIYGFITRLKPRYLKMFFGSVDLYSNHLDAAREQLSRDPKRLPWLQIDPQTQLELDPYIIKFHDYPTIQTLNDILLRLYPQHFIIHDYNPYPAIKAPLSTGLK